MAKSYIQRGELWKMILRRIWLVILSTAAIVLMLPRNNAAQYDYELDVSSQVVA